jgi:hypothetical protein
MTAKMPVPAQAIKEAFASDAIALLKYLGTWAQTAGATLTQTDAQWPREGFIELANVNWRVQICVRTPSELGTVPEINGAWGLKIHDVQLGSNDYVARWPGCWRHCNLITKAWDEIDLHSHIVYLLEGWLHLGKR